MTNPNYQGGDAEQQTFTPAIHPGELVADRLDQYVVDWLPGQAEHMNNVIQMITQPSEQPKDESLSDALAEQQREGIKYEGFESDPDFADLDAQLKTVFGDELLDACLINKIAYYPDTVAAEVEGKFYAIPAEQYAAVQPSLPNPNKDRFRAFSHFTVNQRTEQWQRLPIMVYSFEGESMQDKTYLPEELNEDEKLRLYKIGTVVHEVAHGIYDNVFSEEERDEWDTIAAATAPLTEYVKNYEGKPVRANEQLAEAVRLATTNPDYLNEQSSEIADFIRRRLPHLRKITLSKSPDAGSAL